MVSQARHLMGMVALLLAASAAQAWDPNAGAEPLPVRNTATRHLPPSIVPDRYYTTPNAPMVMHRAPVVAPAAVAPTPVAAPVRAVAAAAPAPAPTPVTAATVPITYQPAPTQAAAPTSNPVVIAPPQPMRTATPPVAVAQAAPAYYPPAYVPTQAMAPVAYVPPQAAEAPAFKANRFALGIEAFHDHYEEPDTFPDLNDNAYYGAVDLGYEHYFSPRYYAAFDGRAAYGENDYKSNSGKMDGVPQWEFDARLLGGYDQQLKRDTHLKFYAGLGSRYYLDEAGNRVTNTGAYGYDRRIFQLYMPIGMTYEFPAYGLQFAPNLEVDPLLYGNVQSRLQNIPLPGFEEFNNRQSFFSGVGVRAEFMVGKQPTHGIGWQAGPFVRYWSVDDSEIDRNVSGGGMEPRNTRVQLGAKVKMLF